MAGIPGMGKPSDIKPTIPAALSPELPAEAPKSSLDAVLSPQLPEASTTGDNSLESLFVEMGGGEQTSSELESLFQQMSGVNEATPAQLAEAENTDASSDEPGVLKQFGMLAQDIANPLGTAVNVLTGGEARSRSLWQGAFDRFKASFARSPETKLKTLEGMYGSDSVKKAGDNFLIKKDGKWTKFDSDKFELVKDVLDHGADILEQGITEAATAGGLALATGEASVAPLTGGASLLAVPGTVAAARAGGGLAGTAARDAVGKLIGVDNPDESLASGATRYASNAALNVIGGRIADYVGGKLADRAARAAADKLKSNAEVFADQLKLTNEASQVLKESGLLNNYELTLIEQVPDSVEAQEAFKRVAKLPEVQQLFKLKADSLDEANKALFKQIANFTGSSANVAEEATSYINNLRKVEGTHIDNFRKAFVTASGDGELPTPKMAQAINDMADNLGFRVSGNGLVEPTVDDLVRQGYTPEGAKVIKEKLGGLVEEIFNKENRFTAKELMGLWKEYDGLTKTLWERGPTVDKAYRGRITDIKNAVRNELIDKMGVVLGDNSGYKESLAKYSSIMTNIEQLGNLMDTNPIASMAYVKQIFSKGKDGLADVRAMKSALADKPEIFEKLKGEFLGGLIENAKDAGSGRVDWPKVQKQLSSLGPEILSEMMGTGYAKQFESLKVLGANLAKAQKLGGFSQADAANIGKDAFLAIKDGSGFAGARAFMQSLGQLDTEKLLAQSVTKDGAEQFLAKVPQRYKPWFKTILENFAEGVGGAAQSVPVKAMLRQRGQEFSKTLMEAPPESP